MKRYILRELAQQRIIRERLLQAQARTGFTLPARVPVTLETLQEVRAALEGHFAQALAQGNPKLN